MITSDFKMGVINYINTTRVFAYCAEARRSMCLFYRVYFTDIYFRFICLIPRREAEILIRVSYVRSRPQCLNSHSFIYHCFEMVIPPYTWNKYFIFLCLRDWRQHRRGLSWAISLSVFKLFREKAAPLVVSLYKKLAYFGSARAQNSSAHEYSTNASICQLVAEHKRKPPETNNARKLIIVILFIIPFLNYCRLPVL